MTTKKLALIRDESSRKAEWPPSDLVIYRPISQDVHGAIKQVQEWDAYDINVCALPPKALYFNHSKVLEHHQTIKKWVQTSQPLNTQDLPSTASHQKRGLHLKQCQMVKGELLKREWVSLLRSCGFGTSLHSLEELKALHLYLKQTDLTPDYVLLSNVFATTCKAGKSPIGRSELEAIIFALRTEISTSNTKIFLLGGVDEHNVHELKDFDHDGICVMSLACFPERLKKLWKALKSE